jgi:hypothetical protein
VSASVSTDSRRTTTAVVLTVTFVATALVTLPGRDAPPGRTLILLALAFCGWAGLLAIALKWGTLTRRTVLVVALAGGALAIAAPPVGSTDVGSYAVYGRMVASHHASPYTRVPADFPNDPWLPRMATFWHHTGSVYGPLFTGVSAAFMKVAGASFFTGRFLFQLLALGAFVAILFMIDRLTRGDPAALVFVGLNPLMVASVVNGAHNDILVGAAVLAAVMIVMEGVNDRRVAIAGAAVAVACLVKLVALLALVALAAWLLVHYGRRAAAVLSGAGLGITAAGYLLAGGPSALRPLLGARDRALLPSVWGYPRRWSHHDVGALALVGIAALAAIVIVSRLRDRTPVGSVGGALLAYTLAGAYVMAWYPAWVLPVVAARWRSRIAAIAAVQSSFLLLAFVELPSQLHGWPLTVERFLHDTLLPLLQLALILLLVGDGLRRMTMARKPSSPWRTTWPRQPRRRSTALDSARSSVISPPAS